MKLFGNDKTKATTTNTNKKDKKMSKKKIAGITALSFFMLTGIAACNDANDSPDTSDQSQQQVLMSPSQEYTPAPTQEPAQEATQEVTTEPTQEPTQEATPEPTKESAQERGYKGYMAHVQSDGEIKWYDQMTGAQVESVDPEIAFNYPYTQSELSRINDGLAKYGYTFEDLRWEYYAAELLDEMKETQATDDVDMDGYIDCLNTNPEDTSDEAIQYCIDTYL